MNKGKCVQCSKTVYSTECITVGPPNKEQHFHNTCFKCQQPGCTWKLTVGSYRFSDGKVFCQAHDPSSGASYGGHTKNQRDINSSDIQHAMKQQKETPLVNNEVRKTK